MFKKITICFLFFLTGLISVRAGDIVVIANGNSGISSMTRSELKDVFLGAKTHWENNKKIILSILVKSETENRFNRTFLSMTLDQFVRHWMLRVYAGKGKFPKTLDTEQMLVKFVGSTNGAIGYVSSEADISTENVKIIEITE